MSKITYAIYTVQKNGRKDLNYQNLNKTQAKKVISDTDKDFKGILLDAEKTRLKALDGLEFSVVALNSKTGGEQEVARYRADISPSGKRLVKV